MDIRRMVIEDYDAVLALWQDMPGLGLRGFDDSRAGIARFLRRNPGTSFVALEQCVAAGAVLSGHDGRRGHIYHAAVRSGMRRSGIGKALVAAVVEALRKENIHKVSLTTFADNEEGNLFWESVGFRRRADLLYRDTIVTSEEELAAPASSSP